MPAAAVAQQPSDTALRLDLSQPEHRLALRGAIEAEKLARRQIASLAEFVKAAWAIVEPETPMEWAPYLDLICAKLEAVHAGLIRHLVICIPPGHMKSLLVAVFFPAWQWLDRPGERLLFLANSDDLARRDSRKTRQVITSDWYRGLVARVAKSRGEEPWTLADDQNEVDNFENSARGFRQCLGINANITGRRGHGIVVDDPIDAKTAINASPAVLAARMEKIANIYEQVVASRLNDRRTGYRIVIAQRLHPADLPGHLIARGDVEHLVLPLEYDPEHPQCHPEDPRTEKGAPLHPQRDTPNVIEELKTELRGQYEAQCDQRPKVGSGALISRSWLQRYAADPRIMRFDEVGISVDATFGKSDSSDYVAIGVWGRAGHRFFRLHGVRARMSYPETRETLRAVILPMFPEASFIFIEAKANGQALIDELRGSVRCAVIGDDDRSRKIAAMGKYARANAVAPLFQGAAVFLPMPPVAWLKGYEDEVCNFPGVLNDDQMDETSQILLHWTWVDAQDGGNTVESAQNFLGFLG